METVASCLSLQMANAVLKLRAAAGIATGFVKNLRGVAAKNAAGITPSKIHRVPSSCIPPGLLSWPAGRVSRFPASPACTGENQNKIQSKCGVDYNNEFNSFNVILSFSHSVFKSSQRGQPLGQQADAGRLELASVARRKGLRLRRSAATWR